MDNILSVKNGNITIDYMIERVIRLDGNVYFTIFNLSTMDFMFGEFTGELPTGDEEAIMAICEDFRNGCKHIVYPDGYIVDDLYEMIDLL